MLTRTERFAHGSFSVEILLPLAPDELIDVSEFNVDERLPYWADLWPSALALTRHLLDAPLPTARVLELGSGVALPSLALAWSGASVVATDYYADALEFARLNAEHNRISPPATLLFDWRDPPAPLGRFELVIAADVVYERRNAEMLAAILPELVSPAGRVLIADPGRIYLPDLLEAVREMGWVVREVETREETSAGGIGTPPTLVRIVELTPGRTVDLKRPGDQRPPPKA